MTQTPSTPSGGQPSTSIPAGAPANTAATNTAATSRTDAAKQDAAEVAGTVKQGVSDVAQEAGEQAREVAGRAKDQARELVDQATSELRTRADEQSARAAAGLDQLAARVRALAAGRPEEAGPLRDYAVELGQRTQRVAERLRTQGADGVLDDLRSLARRRPGMFLAGAAAAGFVAGRLVKAQRANASGPDGQAPTGVPGGRPTFPADRVAGSEPPVYGTAPAVTEVPPLPSATRPPMTAPPAPDAPVPLAPVQAYPSEGVGAVGAVERERRP